jgi:hypothetical protein
MDAADDKVHQSPPSASKPAETEWSIQIRTVGGEQKASAAAATNGDFHVHVHPEDGIQSLYEKIQGLTGLFPAQQRLIYRGRLIAAAASSAPPHTNDDATATTSSSETTATTKAAPLKIREIDGLSDGHTIHLLQRRATPPLDRGASEIRPTAESASILSSLLGLGNTNTNNNNNHNNAPDPSGTVAEGSPSARRWRRLGGRRGRSHYRLSAEDLEVPDPGAMESVRQGMLTLHGMLATATTTTETTTETTVLDRNRPWYRGQWIDCRDTVNQWLEATIVDLIAPEEILPPREGTTTDNTTAVRSPTLQAVNDPAVAADDMIGRTRLLLQVCPEGREDQNEGGEWEGFCRRSTNQGVFLLLVHYNGWPHRWDEWIRSDSERIRPFRVRTRHATTAAHVSPTVQVPYADSPPTWIRGTSDAEDRNHVLPEVLRLMDQVQTLVAAAAGTTTDRLPHASPPGSAGRLPWLRNDEAEEEEDNQTVESSVALSSVAEISLEDQPVIPVPQRRRTPRDQRLALQALAPLLDRLGRTLVDVAPHVASLAAVQNEQSEEPAPLDTIDEHPSSLGGLLSMLSRDRRRNSLASSQAVASLSTTTEPTIQTATSIVDQQTVTSHADVNSEVSIDPDYTDFASGMVNTTRGEVRTGPRSRASSSSDELSSLLGAYLTAASLSGDDDSNNNLQLLSRLLRDRGAGGEGGTGGGIDIHIHAVVTTPGMGAPNAGGSPGGGGTTIGGGGTAGLGGATGLGGTTGLGALLAGLGGGATTTTAPTGAPATTLADDLNFLQNTRRPSVLRLRTPAALQQQDDDLGIFSEL